MSRFSERYSVIASTAALFIAVSTGGAFAASALIDGKTIKPGTVKTKQLAKNAVDGSKVKDGSLSASDFKASSLPAGPKGDTGPAGATGPKGRDAGDAIPSGTTVTGAWNFDSTATTAQAVNDNETVALPGVTPNTLTATEVNFAPGDSAIGDADSTCTGTTEAPTAPAGKVCLYAASVTNLSTIRGFAMSSNYGSRRAFRVNVTAPAANADIFAGGTWAYTAP